MGGRGPQRTTTGSRIERGNNNMQGNYEAGWYEHPSNGLIKIYNSAAGWVYRCYTRNGDKPLSKERPLDQWVWALSVKRPDGEF